MSEIFRADELISVIVPVHNGERHLGETLASIAAQTHRNIEAIIVDDGSTDNSSKIAKARASYDPRFRVLNQEHGGVARARNAGLKEARGRLVAPCDADDLWAPTHLARQLAAWRAGPSDLGLVYSWTATIDQQGRVLDYDKHHRTEGHVFREMCENNLVGSGSAATMRRDFVLAIGGYDSRLQDLGIYGCEDYRLYLQIASRHAIGYVPEYLVAYRESPKNMSSDYHRMLRSLKAVITDISEEYPKSAEALAIGRRNVLEWYRRRALRSWQPIMLCRLQWEMMTLDREYAIKSFYWSFVKPYISHKGKSVGRGVQHRFLGSMDKGDLWSYGSGANFIYYPIPSDGAPKPSERRHV